MIVLKGGRRPEGSKVALTHSGNIVGSDAIFDAALQRAGAVRVHSMVQLFAAAKCLSARYLPVGRRLGSDFEWRWSCRPCADFVNEVGLQLAHLPADVVKGLQKKLSPFAVLDDLIDLSQDANEHHYREV